MPTGPKLDPKAIKNGNQISYSDIAIGQSEKQALLNSVRSKVMRSSFSMDKEKPTKKTKIASDFYQRLKKRMMYR